MVRNLRNMLAAGVLTYLFFLNCVMVQPSNPPQDQNPPNGDTTQPSEPPPNISCSTGTWTYIGSIPNSMPGRNNQVTATVNGKIYMGLGNTNDLVFNDWWMFDPQTGQWTRLPDFPGKPRDLAFSFVIGHVIYVGGGDSLRYYPYADFYAYDTQSNSWKSVASLPYELSSASATSDGQYGYVFGGETYMGYEARILRYDPTNDQWSVMDTVPGGAGRRAPFIIYDSGYLYLGTGRINTTDYLSDFYRYQLSTGTWELLPDHPYPVYEAWPVIVNQKLYLLGGHKPVAEFTDQYYAYNFQTGSWEAIRSFPGGPRNDLRGGADQGRIYVGMGVTPYLTFPPDWWMFCAQ